MNAQPASEMARSLFAVGSTATREIGRLPVFSDGTTEPTAEGMALTGSAVTVSSDTVTADSCGDVAADVAVVVSATCRAGTGKTSATASATFIDSTAGSRAGETRPLEDGTTGCDSATGSKEMRVGLSFL